MATEFTGLIKADLASLTNAASDLAQQAGAIAPAANFGNANAAQQFSFAQSMVIIEPTLITSRA